MSEGRKEQRKIPFKKKKKNPHLKKNKHMMRHFGKYSREEEKERRCFVRPGQICARGHMRSAAQRSSG